jgi:hypothetical protein
LLWGDLVTFGCEAERPAELVHSEEHDGVLLARIDELDQLRLPAGYAASIRKWASGSAVASSTGCG